MALKQSVSRGTLKKRVAEGSFNGVAISAHYRAAPAAEVASRVGAADAVVGVLFEDDQILPSRCNLNY